MISINKPERIFSKKKEKNFLLTKLSDWFPDTRKTDKQKRFTKIKNVIKYLVSIS